MGEIADGVVLNAYVPPAYVRYAVAEIRSAATAAGRDPNAIDIACMLVIRLTDDPDSIRPTLKQRIVRLLDEPHVGEILLEKGGFDPVDPQTIARDHQERRRKSCGPSHHRRDGRCLLYRWLGHAVPRAHCRISPSWSHDSTAPPST